MTRAVTGLIPTGAKGAVVGSAARGVLPKQTNFQRFGVLQRKCGCEGPGAAFGECAECKAERGAPLQRATVGDRQQGRKPDEVPPIVHEVLRSPGQPLDTATRAFMEPRFGQDFSGVRVHADTKAAESARAVNAFGYTVGPDVVFGAGRFAPNSTAGSALLAHELTHVVQQAGGPRNGALSIDPDAAMETEADRVARAVVTSSVRGPAFSQVSGGGLSVQRQPAEPAPTPPPAGRYEGLKPFQPAPPAPPTPAPVTAPTSPQVVRADEAGKGGRDRLAGQDHACTITSGTGIKSGDALEMKQITASTFVPSGIKPDANRVLVFFSPSAVTGASGYNEILEHGLRGSADPTEWIIIGVPFPDVATMRWATIDDAAIGQCLVAAGRGPKIASLRLAGYSRGGISLRQTVSRKLISAAVERVFVLDADYQETASLLGKGSVSAKDVTFYDATVPDNPHPLPGSKKVQLPPKDWIRAIGYSRLILDAKKLRPNLTIPKEIDNQLLPLPDRGQLTTKKTPPNSKAPKNILDFAQENLPQILKIIKNADDAAIGLRSFVYANDLQLYGKTKFSPDEDAHHFFVAEIGHEMFE